MSVRLSIVIPTKDRYECLFVLIETLLCFKRTDFEIIVADNSPDNRPWLSFAERVTDSRVRYNHVAHQLPIIDNCDIGIGMARGDVVSMLGDDDGIAEWALEVADWMCDCDVDAVYGNRPVYLWPGVSTRVVGSGQGTFTLEEPSGVMREVDNEHELRWVLDRGGTELGLIPRVYHGLVQRRSLDALRAQAGTCFPGPSPDMANGVGLSRFATRMYWIDFPVVITGNMPRSGGGMGTKREHVGNLDRPHLPKGTDAGWTPFIPKFWSGPTIWAESAVQALRAVRPELEARMNYPYLYASCRVFLREYDPETDAARRALISSGRVSAAECRSRMVTSLVRVYSARAGSFARNIAYRFGISRFVRVEGHRTIQQCMDYLHERYGGRRKPWDG